MIDYAGEPSSGNEAAELASAAAQGDSALADDSYGLNASKSQQLLDFDDSSYSADRGSLIGLEADFKLDVDAQNSEDLLDPSKPFSRFKEIRPDQGVYLQDRRKDAQRQILGADHSEFTPATDFEQPTGISLDERGSRIPRSNALQSDEISGVQNAQQIDKLKNQDALTSESASGPNPALWAMQLENCAIRDDGSATIGAEQQDESANLNAALLIGSLQWRSNANNKSTVSHQATYFSTVQVI